MDNDKKIVKKLKSLYRSVEFKINYWDKNVLSEQSGNNLIFQMIEAGKPFMVGRLGAIEARCIYPWMIGREPKQNTLNSGMHCAGIFPATNNSNSEFSKIYSNAISNTDVIGLWSVYKEKDIVNKYSSNATFIRVRSIEPYYFINPWSKALEDKRVLIIHPFIESIKKQYLIREKIFENKDILPRVKSIEFLKAIQSNAGADSGFESWSNAYLYMCNEIKRKKFDIAIIGAGAYGLPLASYVKSIGKIGIQMSGSTQILFGIKGMRWDDHPVISKMYNDHWIRPSAEETPPKPEKVEGGSYW
ncbi:hypothetical protein CN451_13235 [Priestia megaterium]|uniref:hypothetical protein n=1 Tax=Priestia megaterium TaxID=1404 RepID=UPI000BF5A5F6|nr:hypothetical protein [Priestia megaterium]PEX10218.1 hypothetical protein CN451_13235 [Priestia megaterium]